MNPPPDSPLLLVTGLAVLPPAAGWAAPCHSSPSALERPALAAWWVPPVVLTPEAAAAGGLPLCAPPPAGARAAEGLSLPPPLTAEAGSHEALALPTGGELDPLSAAVSLCCLWAPPLRAASPLPACLLAV